MERNNNTVQVKDHNITIDNRQLITFTGVTDVGDFSDDQIVVFTTKGGCLVKGKNLKVQKLDVESGKVVVEGTVNSLNYTDKKEKDEIGLLGRIFR